MKLISAVAVRHKSCMDDVEIEPGPLLRKVVGLPPENNRSGISLNKLGLRFAF
jgi:hypothetical protein